MDRPAGRPAIRMTWESVLFMHWPVPRAALRGLVPKPLEIDVFDGTGWVGLVPFTMPVVGSTWLPPIPTAHRFHECNVRTYVRLAGEPGVYFFSLDAASRLAVWAARRFWQLPYHLARIDLRREDSLIHYTVDRVGRRGPRLRCAWKVGAPRSQARPGNPDFFLTERYALYSFDRRGQPRRCRIHHEPWRLYDAELVHLDDTLVAAAGIRLPEIRPVMYCADHLDVLAWPLEDPSEASTRV